MSGTGTKTDAATTDPATEDVPKTSFGRRAVTGFGGMFAGFRTFILRGNIIELAVGVVIGVAFNALVTGFTTDFIQPLIKVIGGGKELSGTFKIGEQRFLYAAFINQIINFLMIAAVLYFVVVMPMNKINERRARLRGDQGEKAVPDDIALLTEIRDALVEANRRDAPTAEAASPTASEAAVPTQPTAADADTRPVAPPRGSTASAPVADAPPVAPPRRPRPSDKPPAQ